jgi:uncharacterized membrane protein
MYRNLSFKGVIYMESRAKLFGHPLHQILIVFPLGLLATSLILDVMYLSTKNPRWSDFSFILSGAGVAGGVIASVFGLVDWLAIPLTTRAKRVGAIHGAGNIFVMFLFGASWILRYDAPLHQPSLLALVLSFTGGFLTVFTAWLGGELVSRLGVGVDDGAHLDATSSLSRSSRGSV